jgi:hypothetical protein
LTEQLHLLTFIATGGTQDGATLADLRIRGRFSTGPTTPVANGTTGDLILDLGGTTGTNLARLWVYNSSKWVEIGTNNLTSYSWALRQTFTSGITLNGTLSVGSATYAEFLNTSAALGDGTAGAIRSKRVEFILQNNHIFAILAEQPEHTHCNLMGDLILFLAACKLWAILPLPEQCQLQAILR